MGTATGISYVTATYSPIRGCTPASAGCKNCWAVRDAIRRSAPGKQCHGLVKSTSSGPKWTGEVKLIEKDLDAPLHWRAPQRVAVCFGGDLFHERVPDEWIDRVFAVMALAPHHTFQVLTKRPARMREYMSRWDVGARVGEAADWVREQIGVKDEDSALFRRVLDGFRSLKWPAPNVWLGVSVEDQATGDARIPLLLQTPAAKRWVSLEPLLGPVDLCAWLPATEAAFAGNGYRMARGAVACAGLPKLDWIVAGGESGPGARPCDLAWLRAIVAQCGAAGVPCYVKQDSGRKPGQQGRIPDDLWIKEVPDAVQEFPA